MNISSLFYNLLKHLILQRGFLILFILFYLSNYGYSQTASVSWYLTADSNVSATAGSVIGQTESFSGMERNNYTTVPGSGTGTSQRCRIIGGSWPSDTIHSKYRYIQFAVTPKSGNVFNVNSISMYYGGMGGGGVRSNIFYSTDSSFTAATQLNSTTLSNSVTAGSMVFLTYTPSVTVNDGQTLYVRIYPWNNVAATGKYVCLQNVTISGSAVSSPIPASATWYLTADQNLSATSGSVIGQTQELSGMDINGYQTVAGSGPGNSQLSKIIGGSWPADTNQNKTRYIQFAVSPKIANTFNINSISMYYGGKGGGNVKANISYSTDSSFTTFTQLNPIGTPLAISVTAGIMQLLSYTPSIVLNENQTLYLRVFPWYTSVSSGKYVCLQNVMISGTTTGPASADLPTVTTKAITNVSTTSAVCGGSVSSDGGATVTSRGVCWNTAGNPTITDNKTSDSTGAGQFVSLIKGLLVGTKYYVRAYATNIAGTSYGKMDSLTTLSALTVPTIVTSDPSNIMVISATSGGNVTAWGGTDVTARGVCWNTSGNPTISDNKTSDGIGIGSFTSIITGLTKTTKYFVRAYASNNQGTAYGDVKEFTTQAPAANVKKIVAADGTGDYATVQAAFDAIPDNYTGSYTIFIKKGTYKEKITLGKNKTNVIIQGEDRKKTILTYDDYSGRVVGSTTIGTSTSQSVWIQGNDITIYNLTIQNTSTLAQAVAINLTGDRIGIYNCDILGYQDTYYNWNSGRVYNKDCFVEGTVDFIFGNGITIFDNCTINEKRDGGTLTAASTVATLKFGYVFLNCKLTIDSIGYDGKPITKFYLGRPWQNVPQTVFINCNEPATLDPAGWLAWNVVPALYAEYKCTGAGFLPVQRASISRQLTDAEAVQYTIANIFSKNSGVGAWDWTPQLVLTSVKGKKSEIEKSDSYKLYQNFPNPFNPETKITYEIKDKSFVAIKIFNLLGQEIETLVNQDQLPGVYSVNWNPNSVKGGLSSGIYYYQIKTDNFLSTKKMLYCK